MRFFANSITPEGEGSLQIAYEKLKQQLESEGLFAQERKRQLPSWPSQIGLITAKDSSAYHDLVKIISARMNGLVIKLLPVNVQGREAVRTINSALSYINGHPSEFDVIIIARGGGSLEDLQAFNDESVVRSIFSLKVPSVSAIGHEDNWSLSDYVADLRASTPSNAAELVVKDKQQVIVDIDLIIQRTQQQLQRQIERIKNTINWSNQISKRYATGLHQHIDQIQVRLSYLLKHRLELYRQEIDNLTRLIGTLDYQKILNRGFSITTDSTGTIIKSADSLTSQQQIFTQLAQGKITSHVEW